VSASGLPLRRYLGEAVVVVGSILIAFGVDAWWDGRQAAQREQVILAELERDFQASLEGLDSLWIPTHRAALHAGLELLWIIQTGSADGFPEPPEDGPWTAGSEAFLLPLAAVPFSDESRTVQVRDSLVAVALFEATYDPTLATLDALAQGDGLGVLSSQALRSALAEFSAVLADSRDEELRTRALVNDELRPALRRAGNLVLPEIVAWRFLAAALPVVAPVPEPLRNHVLQLRVDGEVANILASRLRLQMDVVGTLGNVREMMQVVLTLIGEELEG
jgi:hypothetical protein